MVYSHTRLAREFNTIEKMAYIFCHQKHDSPKGQLCPECQEMVDYAAERLNRCPFQQAKPTCAKCTVHCYKPVMREKVRVMMRTAGPVMLFHHPYLAIMHLVVDSRRKPPVLERKSSAKQAPPLQED